MGRPKSRRTIGGIIACCLWVVMALVGIVRAGTLFHDRVVGDGSSSSNYATSLNQPDYHALGIQQPSLHALGMKRSSRFWWQDSNDSPFQEGTAKKVGVRATSFGVDPPRAHSRPNIQDFRQQNLVGQQQQQFQGDSTGSAATAFSGLQTAVGGRLPPPYPGCAAALKCVQEDFCDILGVMINNPVHLSPQQKENRVPLMPCLNTETNENGFCCRDPLYEDPWPADMPMPSGMPSKPTVPVPTTAAIVSVPPTPSRPAPPTPQPTGYPYQPVPSPSFPIPVPSTDYLPPNPVVHPPPSTPNTNYLPPVPVQPSVPTPNFNKLPSSSVAPPSPQAYTQAPPPTTPQKPWTGELAPVTPHPGCAAALKCVPEELCSLEGIMINKPVSLTPFEKDYLRVPLMSCLNKETNREGFCCRDPLYEDPWPADMPMPGMAVKPLPVPVTTNTIAVVRQPAVVQQQYFPPPVQQQQSHLAAVSVQQTYIPPVPQQNVFQPATVKQHQLTLIQQPTHTHSQSSGHQQQQEQQKFQPYVGPLAADQPFPGCAAALKCVEELFCNMEGVMVNEPVSLTPLQKEFRVPLMTCLNVATNKVGYCCRDPLYEDPWPADVPMTGMMLKQG